MPSTSLLADLQVVATNQLVEALVASENRMRQRVDLLSEVVFELDAASRIVFLNRAWEALMGMPAAALQGDTFSHCLLPEDRPVFEEALAKARKGAEVRRTVVRFARDALHVIWMELSVAVIDGGFVGALHDITEQKRVQDQLEYIAHYDVLTTMPNRTLLSDRINQAMDRCERLNVSLAVAFLDLDGFKSINDNHGHEAGDQLLTALAKRLKSSLREGDSIARIGGDEFVAVLVDLDFPHQCDSVLQRMLAAASDTVTVGDLSLKVSASIGVTLYPQDRADAEQLIRHADQAMYVAKQEGKNRFHFFDVALESAQRDHSESLDRIQQALRQDEFVLMYQPKVNMLTSQVFGAEALIRWQHPERGLLSPEVFLPTIENHALSVRLGEWVIAAALSQRAEWARAGLDIVVSVNIAAYHLLDEGFVDSVRRLLSAHPKLAPGRLTFEILETSALDDLERVSQVIRDCQAMGIAFALDDFGTGYSSLTYLKHLPAESLKIDRSFVMDMLGDRDDLAIVTGVIGLATAFKRELIAEGVETRAHMNQLLALGCHSAQGYGIARPMAGGGMLAWVQAGPWLPP